MAQEEAHDHLKKKEKLIERRYPVIMNSKLYSKRD